MFRFLFSFDSGILQRIYICTSKRRVRGRANRREKYTRSHAPMLLLLPSLPLNQSPVEGKILSLSLPLSWVCRRFLPLVCTSRIHKYMRLSSSILAHLNVSLTCGETIYSMHASYVCTLLYANTRYDRKTTKFYVQIVKHVELSYVVTFRVPLMPNCRICVLYYVLFRWNNDAETPKLNC